MTTSRAIGLCCVAAALAGYGCSKDKSSEEIGVAKPFTTEGGESRTTTAVEEWQPDAIPSSGAKQTGEKPAAMTLTDGEIARITEVVNAGEIEQAQLAKGKALNPDVQRFAEHMLTDHRKALDEGQQLAKREKFVIEESSLATELENESTRAVDQLRAAEPGGTFDRAYMHGQVTAHQKVLDLIDKQLIPSATDAELTVALQKTRTMVQKHLDEAREIDAAID